MSLENQKKLLEASNRLYAAETMLNAIKLVPGMMQPIEHALFENLLAALQTQNDILSDILKEKR